ncbi:hypothetical protein [Nocardia sp. NPDC050717]|uniref:hypothetical protein n=1 Tax=Nocardia sp. NPDC050717 TaxID=3157221 RepID=UPI0033CC48B8
MYVDWVSYYDAAKKCHDLAADLRAADKPVHDALEGDGAGMAGDAPGCVEWAQAYDGVARSTLQACTNLADALTNFGNVLYASGYNYGISNNSDPAPPYPTITAMTEYKVDFPSATTTTSSMGVRNDGNEEFFNRLLDEITKEFKKLPNADIDALSKVSTVWSTFAASEALSGAKARITTISEMFDKLDRIENRAVIQQHLNTISTSADTIVLAGQNIAAPIAEFNTGIHETNAAINREVTLSLAGVAIAIGAAAVGFLFTMGGSTAIAAARIGICVTNAMTGIRNALNAEKLLKILGFTAAFGGAVAAITAFDKVPDTGQVTLALAEIIAMKVLVDEAADEGAEEAAEVLDVVTDEAGELIGTEDAANVQIVSAAALEQARQELTDKLGAPEVKPTPKGDIEVWTIPGNPPSTVTYRPFSRSGGPTIDFNNVPGVSVKRWHI